MSASARSPGVGKRKRSASPAPRSPSRSPSRSSSRSRARSPPQSPDAGRRVLVRSVVEAIARVTANDLERLFALAQRKDLCRVLAVFCAAKASCDDAFVDASIRVEEVRRLCRKVKGAVDTLAPLEKKVDGNGRLVFDQKIRDFKAMTSLALYMTAGGLSRVELLHVAGSRDAGLPQMTAPMTMLLAKALVMGALPKLRELKILHSGLGDEAFAKLTAALASPTGPRLEVLELSSNRIGDEGVVSFARAAAKGAARLLSTLALDDNEIRSPGTAKLASALKGGALPQLETLRLDGNFVGNDGAARLFRAGAAMKRLRVLSIDDNDFDHRALVAFAWALGRGVPSILGKGVFPRLHTLVLDAYADAADAEVEVEAAAAAEAAAAVRAARARAAAARAAAAPAAIARAAAAQADAADADLRAAKARAAEAARAAAAPAMLQSACDARGILLLSPQD